MSCERCRGAGMLELARYPDGAVIWEPCPDCIDGVPLQQSFAGGRTGEGAGAGYPRSVIPELTAAGAGHDPRAGRHFSRGRRGRCASDRR